MAVGKEVVDAWAKDRRKFVSAEVTLEEQV